MDRRVQKTKTAIQSAYMELFLEKRTAKITVTDIAKKANIDRKTFYLHYESTEDVIKEITEEKMNQFLIILKKYKFSEKPYDAHAYFRCMNELLEQDIDFLKRIVQHPDFHYFWEQIEAVMIRTLTSYFSEIVDLNKEEIIVYTTFFASGINNVFTKWLRNEIPVSLEELGHIVSDITYYGAQKFLPPY